MYLPNDVFLPLVLDELKQHPDVLNADEWNTATVGTEHMSESLGYDPYTLDYTALIAPLVAYCQHLEKRIDAMTKENS